MSEKFEIEQLEERVAPSTMSIGGLSVGVTGTDSVSAGLPLGLGTVSADVNANNSVAFSGISLPGLPALPAL